MPNEISDKIYVIVEEAKKTTHKNAVVFADTLAKKKLDEFSYVRGGRIQYCDLKTIRDYISFAKDVGALTEELKIPSGVAYRSKVGFENWLGDVVLKYLDDNNLAISTLKSHALKLVSAKTLPTTDKLFEEADADIASKHFRWSLTVIQNVKPLLLGVCRKWVWVPGDIFKF
jgi:hypothetical protein